MNIKKTVFGQSFCCVNHFSDYVGIVFLFFLRECVIIGIGTKGKNSCKKEQSLLF